MKLKTKALGLLYNYTYIIFFYKIFKYPNSAFTHFSTYPIISTRSKSFKFPWANCTLAKSIPINRSYVTIVQNTERYVPDTNMIHKCRFGPPRLCLCFFFQSTFVIGDNRMLLTENWLYSDKLICTVEWENIIVFSEPN